LNIEEHQKIRKL